MSTLVFHKLLAIFCAVALGWIAGRRRWLGPAPEASKSGGGPARLLGDAAFMIFVPALLFRTTARLDLPHMPWAVVAAFFVPVLGVLALVYLGGRWHRAGSPAADLDESVRMASEPATRAIAVVFGNSVQIGIPMAAALFGEAGLGVHIPLVSLHALVLLSVLTALIELDTARARALHDGGTGLWRTLRTTARNTVIHPVVLPVLAGLAWNVSGLPLPGPLDEMLQLLGTAVAPMCLVVIGLSLATTSIEGAVAPAVLISVLKLLVVPATVLGVAHWGFGLAGTPLHVVVMLAAMPTGSNALIFAQRYRAQEAEATTAIVLSTFAFVFTAPMWLAVLAWVG